MFLTVYLRRIEGRFKIRNVHLGFSSSKISTRHIFVVQKAHCIKNYLEQQRKYYIILTNDRFRDKHLENPVRLLKIQLQ